MPSSSKVPISPDGAADGVDGAVVVSDKERIAFGG